MSKRGHVPQRMCTGCRQRRKKGEMVRLIQMSKGVMVLDGKKILQGRGFYLCPNPACLRMARKRGRLERVVGMDETDGSLDRRLSPSWDDHITLERVGLASGVSHRRNRNGEN